MCGRESVSWHRKQEGVVFCDVIDTDMRKSVDIKVLYLQATTLHDSTTKVERRIDLVYGGGSVGLMGLVSQAVHDGGRHVLGVIPRTLMPREITGETVGEVKAVADMHERKAEMARQADAFIALPGGYGTLEELLEVITWAQLRIHHKPVGLLNVEGYYNSLLSFIDKAVDEGFISPTARRIIVSAPNAKQLVRELEEFVPEYDEIAAKLTWDEVDRLNYVPEAGVAGVSTDEIATKLKWDEVDRLNYVPEAGVAGVPT